MLTSPNNKRYIGQTRRMFDKRFREHVHNAELGKCTALSAAIRKYGAEAFTKEILYECPVIDLNDAEIMSIDLYSTMYPKGYNLQIGGTTSGGAIYDEALRTKISDAHRKFTHADFELPMYVRYIKEGEKEGFRVNVPNKKAYTFYDSKLTLHQKYDLVMEKYQAVLDNTDDQNENRKKKSEYSKQLPKYVSYTEIRDCFEVRVPGHPRKSFRDVNDTTEQKHEKAIQYLNSILAMQFND